ncbi:MAG: glycerol transport system permease protein, partial [Burkholderiales bacterium]
FKTNEEIVGALTMWPDNLTFDNFKTIFTDPSWYDGYINSIIYVLMKMVFSVAVALPAAYAFSRYEFVGD